MIELDQLDLVRQGGALRWAVARFAYEAFPELAARALEIEAACLSVSRIPALFSRDLIEIHPSLNDDLLDLCGRCERTISNQFTFHAGSEEFPEELDWTLHQGTAWSEEMHAFDYGLDLALNFRISGDSRYARHLRYLMAHWIASNPPGQGDGWMLHPLSRRIRNWVLAADLARQDWENDEDFFRVVTRSLALQTRFLSHYAQSLLSTDARLDSARAMLLAGLFFGGNRGLELSAEGRRIITGELGRHFDVQGRCTQSRPGAQLRLAQALMDFLAFPTGENDGHPLFKNAIHELLEVMASTLLPDGGLPLFGASPAPFGEDLNELFALSTVILNESVWKNLAGKFGILPYMLLGEAGKTQFNQTSGAIRKAATSLLPQAGLFRLSVTEPSAMVINGRIPASLEEHQDGLSFELALRGQRVVVDSGVQFPNEESQNKYFATPGAHNVLLVDGHGAPCAMPGDPPPMAEIWGASKDALGLRLGPYRISPDGTAHQRAWFCLEGESWAVLDLVEGSGTHHIASLIHFYPTFDLKVDGNAAVARSRSLSVSIIPLGQLRPTISASRGSDTKFAGWYSPSIGIKYAASVLRLEWKDAACPWVGGYLIVHGTVADFEENAVDSTSGEINFRLGGNQYRLPISGSSGAWRKTA